MSNTFVLPPDFQPYLRPYRIGLRQHACVVLALLICIWVRVAKVVEFQDNFLTQLWTKICVKYFLLFPQENLPPEKTETNLWAFHPIFRFSFWLTKVTKNENITQQFFLSLFLSCLSCLANRKHCTKNQTGMLQAGGRGQIRRRPQIFRLCNMPVRQPIFVFGNFVNQNKKRKMEWKAHLYITINCNFCCSFGRKINFFTHLLNHQEGNLKVQFLIKIGYYIVPNPSTTLKKGRPEPEMWSMLYIMLVLLMDKFVGLRQWMNPSCTIMLKNFRLVQSRTSWDMDRILHPVSFIWNYSLEKELRRTQAGYSVAQRWPLFKKMPSLACMYYEPDFDKALKK